MTYKNPSFSYLYIRISKEIGNEIIKVWSTTMKFCKKPAVNFDKMGVASTFRSYLHLLIERLDKLRIVPLKGEVNQKWL